MGEKSTGIIDIWGLQALPNTESKKNVLRLPIKKEKFSDKVLFMIV